MCNEYNQGLEIIESYAIADTQFVELVKSLTLAQQGMDTPIWNVQSDLYRSILLSKTQIT